MEDILTAETSGITRQCSGVNRAGERCKRASMKYQSVCAHHGGKTPGGLKGAREVMLSLREPAIEALYRAVRSAPPCPVCGRSDADRDPVTIRAAQLILDRTGLGPTANLSRESTSSVLVVRREIITSSPPDFLDVEGVIDDEHSLPETSAQNPSPMNPVQDGTDDVE
jgi:hypothetical protein